MKSILFAAILLTISACTVRPDFPTLKIPGLTIEGEKGGNNNGSNGKFCPPGQAKKGNC